MASRAKGRLKTVWLHSRQYNGWAISHVAERHGVREEDVILIEYNINTGYVVPTKHRGLWHTGGRDIACTRKMRVIDGVTP